LELLQINYHDTNKPELIEVLQTIEGMGLVQLETFYDNFGQLCFNTIKWKGGAEKGSGGRGRKKKEAKNG
jgi:hypothetical protein